MNLKEILLGAGKKIKQKKDGYSLKRSVLKTVSLSSNNVPLPKGASLSNKRNNVEEMLSSPSNPVGISSRTSTQNTTQNTTEGGTGVALPIIGKYSSTTQIKITGWGLAISILMLLGLMFWYTSQSNVFSSGLATSKELEMLSQRVSNASQQALLGSPAAFEQLNQARDSFNQDLKSISDIASSGNEEMRTSYFAIGKIWNDHFNKNVPLVTKDEKNLRELGNSIANINKNNPLMLELAEQIADLKLSGGATPAEITATSQLVMLTQRIAKNANVFLAGSTFDKEVSFLLGKDTSYFRQLLTGLIKGNEELRLPPPDAESLEKMNELAKIFNQYQLVVSSVLGNTRNLVDAKNASRDMFSNSEKLLDASKASTASYAEATQSLKNIIYVIVVMIVFVVLFSSLLVLIFKREGDASRRAAKEALKNQANQESIDNMLNEMSGVAAGNLSTRLSVESDFTGSIAQAINQSVEALQRIVLRIKQTSQSVAGKTTEADRVAEEVLVYSQQQFDKLQEAVKTIGNMASNADEIAQLTFLVSEESNSSQQASRQGGEIVAQAIERMDKMRETTQEAAKKIKRLGESSQSIGEAITLIQDITRQVNVLALNTAIHAASTGASGRAFGVVAQEVQRLASDSEEATRKIEALVATIQQDTNQAVAVMERTTQEVVEGTRLANSAGQALIKIDGLAGKVNEMVASVNVKLDAQSSEFANMSLSMTGLGKLTENNMSGVRSAVAKVEEVKQEARLLEESVSDFKVD